MGNSIGSVVDEFNDDSVEGFIYSDLDDYEKQELINYIKEMKLQNLEVDDEFSKKVGTLNIECSEPIPMCIELYEKMSKVLEKAQPKKSTKLEKIYFVKPQFKPEDVTNYVELQNRPLAIYQVNLYDVVAPTHPFKEQKITIVEYVDAFNNFTYNKDMIGISKKIMRSLPDYLKLRFVNAYNRYYRDGESPKDLAFAKGSFIYKASKKGPKDQVDSFRSIMVIPNAVNHMHRILAIRLTEYMMKNNYINTTIQKGAVSGQSKPIFQQVFKVKNVINHANNNKNKMAIMFLDISNAYGNLQLHVLYDILRKHHVDEHLIGYLREFYRNFHYYVSSSDWTTETYSWGNQGLVQGCPLSPILFVTALNYVLQHLENTYKAEHGYDIGNEARIMFTAYMDDICLVCKDKDSLVTVYTDLEKQLNQLGLPVNRSKTAIMLVNEEADQSPIEGIDVTKTHKYLGEYISSNGENTESYNMFIKYLGRKLEAIERRKCDVKEKLTLFNNYVMPWIQYRLTTMYDLKTHQKQKVTGLIMKYLKQWDHNGTLNIFITVMDTLKGTDDEVIKKMEIEQNYDQDLEEDVDLSNFVLTGEIIGDYSKIDELDVDLEEVLE